MQGLCIPGLGVPGCSNAERLTTVIGIAQLETQAGGVGNTEPGFSLKDTYIGSMG